MHMQAERREMVAGVRRITATDEPKGAGQTEERTTLTLVLSAVRGAGAGHTPMVRPHRGPPTERSDDRRT